MLFIQYCFFLFLTIFTLNDKITWYYIVRSGRLPVNAAYSNLLPVMVIFTSRELMLLFRFGIKAEFVVYLYYLDIIESQSH